MWTIIGIIAAVLLILVVGCAYAIITAPTYTDDQHD